MGSWLLSPNNFNSGNANVWNVNSTGNLNNNNVDNANGARPVFSRLTNDKKENYI